MKILKQLEFIKIIIFDKFHCPKCNIKMRYSKTNIFKKTHYIKSENYNIELDRPSIANRRKREDVLNSKFTKKTIYNYKCPKCNHIDTLKEF